MKENSEKLMRMKKLSEEAGVPKGTISFYIKEGLVPPPIKTKRNMAYYDEKHLNAIRLVKELQSKRFLPLSIIKQIISRQTDLTIEELQTLFQINGNIFQHLNERPRIKPVTVKKLSKWTGVPLKEIRELEKYGILHPFQKGTQAFYNEDDVRIIELWAKIRAAGFTRELGFDTGVVKIIKETIDGLVKEEARIVLRRVTGKVPSTKVVKMVDDGLQLGTDLLGLLVKESVLEFVRKNALQFQKKVKRTNNESTSDNLN